MESSKVMAVATEIRDQLVVLTNRNILLSWGIEGYKAVIYNEMHSLHIKVNGRLFQGNVLICLNPIDHYEIYLSNNKETRCICDMAYFDMLGDIIDTAIESGTDKVEYQKFCEGERAKLFSGKF